MKKLIIFTALFLSISSLHAQQIEGTVSDTVLRKDLSNVVVTFLRKKDSILVDFTRTDSLGRFTISNLPSGNYYMIMSYPNYGDYIDSVAINQDFRMIREYSVNMIPRSVLLKEVIIRKTVRAVGLKGDTLEFKADSFYVPPNANVEDLLKRLPGVQVDRSGNISVNGKNIEKVLVDGEEFFGDDPTLITQNVRADMVDKIQVYDAKSKKTVFTGVDDGEKTKTLNLKLKENKKNGFFGKILTAAGTQDRFNNQVMLNKFSGNEKLAMYGIWSNDGETGLSRQDTYSYAGDKELNYDNSGLIKLDSWDGSYANRGLPVFKGAGIHYSNKWDPFLQSLNLNYKISDLVIHGGSQTNAKLILPGSILLNSQNAIFNNEIFGNKLSTHFETNLDASTYLEIQSDYINSTKTSSYKNYSEMRREDGNFLNSQLQNISTKEKNDVLLLNLMLVRKFKKSGRSITLTGFFDNDRLKSNGYFASFNKFAGNNMGDSTTEDLDQFKHGEASKTYVRNNMSYTEPLSKYSSLKLNYGLETSLSGNVLGSYLKSSQEHYDFFDSAYSSDYKFSLVSHRAGISFFSRIKKVQFSGGADAGITTFKQVDRFTDLAFRRHFINWYPQAELKYSKSGTESLTLSYNGTTNQPNIGLMQPLRNNSDPLNLALGNPLLKPSFNNVFRTLYINMNPLTQKTIWIDISYKLINNTISTRDFIDSLGKRSYQYANLGNTDVFAGTVSYSFLTKRKYNIGCMGNWNLSRNINVVNLNANRVKNNYYAVALFASKNWDKLFTASVTNNIFYNSSTSSVYQDQPTSFWANEIRIFAECYLPFKLTVNSNFSAYFRQKTDIFNSNSNVVLWDMWVGRKLLKNEALLLKVSAKDILNQNKGIARNLNANYISENSYTVIRRYLMLTAVWNFSKQYKKP